MKVTNIYYKIFCSPILLLQVGVQTLTNWPRYTGRQKHTHTHRHTQRKKLATHTSTQEPAVAEDPEKVGDEESTDGENQRQQCRVGLRHHLLVIQVAAALMLVHKLQAVVARGGREGVVGVVVEAAVVDGNVVGAGDAGQTVGVIGRAVVGGDQRMFFECLWRAKTAFFWSKAMAKCLPVYNGLSMRLESTFWMSVWSKDHIALKQGNGNVCLHSVVSVWG